MRDFIDSKNRVVSAENDADANRQFSSLSAENAWHIKAGSGGMVRSGVDGLCSYVAPDGKTYRAASLEAARAMRDGRPTAKDGNDDDLGGAYAFRQSIFAQYQGAANNPPAKAQSAPARSDDPSGTFAFREAVFAGGRR